MVITSIHDHMLGSLPAAIKHTTLLELPQHVGGINIGGAIFLNV